MAAAGEIGRVSAVRRGNAPVWPRPKQPSSPPLSPNRVAVYGAIALGYGVLEGAEAYGLWRRRRWGEYLTVVATAILLLAEVWEIVRKPTALKIVGTLANLAIVVYLIVRLRRRAAVTSGRVGQHTT